MANLQFLDMPRRIFPNLTLPEKKLPPGETETIINYPPSIFLIQKDDFSGYF